MGINWETALDPPADEVRAGVLDAVLQRAVELREKRDRDLATRIANVINGGKPDG